MMVMNREESMSASNMYNGFSFKKKSVKIDWRKIASVDLDRVANEFDLRTLQDNIDHITFCNIEAEVDSRITDPNYIKLFKMSQLMIEYLIHSQSYLTGVISDLEVQVNKSLTDNEELKAQNHKMHKELNEIKKENKKRKKMIETQQAMLSVTPANHHQCAICSKVFLNQSYLQAHISRRHGNGGGGVVDSTPSRVGGVDSLEVEKLRERLRSTEAELLALKGAGGNGSSMRRTDSFTRQMDEFKSEQSKLRQEELRDYERKTQELNERIASQGQTIQELQQRLATQSHVGWIKDDVDVDKDNYLRMQQELEKLRGIVSNYENNNVDVNAIKTKAKERENHLRQKHVKELGKKDEVIQDLKTRLEQMKSSVGNTDRQLLLKIDELNAQLQYEKAEREKLAQELLTAEKRPKVEPEVPISALGPPAASTTKTMHALVAPPQRPMHSPTVPVLQQQQQQQQPSNQHIILTEYCPLTLRNVQRNPRFLQIFRDNAEKSLGHSLDEIGIDYNDKFLPMADYKQKMDMLIDNRESIGDELPRFSEYRALFASVCEHACKQHLRQRHGAGVMRSSSSSGNRVTFKNDLVAAAATAGTRKRPATAQQHQQRQPEIDEITDDDVSLSNAMESTATDDYTAAKRVASASPRRGVGALSSPRKGVLGQRVNSAEDISELESISQQYSDRKKGKSLNNIATNNSNNTRSYSSVDESRRKIEKQLEEQAARRGSGPAVRNGVPVGFETPTTPKTTAADEEEDSFSSITDLDAENGNKGQQKAKNGKKSQLDSSINSSMWISEQQQNQQNNKNAAATTISNNSNSMPQNVTATDVERPATATSWKTSNLDSDEYDNGLNE